MNFSEFAELVNSHVAPVVLLEGSRNMATAKDAERLAAFGERLAREFPQAVFRSGDAVGADKAFAARVCQINAARLELILAAKTKLQPAQNERRVSLEQLTADEQNELCCLAETATPDYKGLIDYYRRGLMGAPRYKAQYILRDALKVVGSTTLNFQPAVVGCFYLNSDKPAGGGTGHTIRICREKQIPVIMQQDFLNW